MPHLLTILASLLILCSGCKQKDKVTITIEDIKQEEAKAEPSPPPPPPVPDLNLSAFNIFLLNSGAVYYYFEPGFKPSEQYDEFLLEKLNKKYLHKTSFKEVKKIVTELKTTHLLQDKIWLLIQENDTLLRNKAMEEIIIPSGLSSVMIGHFTEELHTLLKTVK